MGNMGRSVFPSLSARSCSDWACSSAAAVRPARFDTAGGGNTRMLVTLAFFIAGSALGAWHLPWWSAQPNVGQISLISAWGWVAALLVSLAGFAATVLLTIAVERRAHGALLSGVTTRRRGWRRFLHGPWPLIAGAVALALGNFATLYLAGRPWGITSALALLRQRRAGFV